METKGKSAQRKRVRYIAGVAVRERTISAVLANRETRRVVTRVILNHPRDFIPGGPDSAPPELLEDALLRGINKAVKRARKNVDAGRNQIYAISLCLCREAAVELVKNPGAVNEDEIPAETLGIRANRQTRVLLLPGSSTVDPLIVSAAVGAETDRVTGPSLIADLGSTLRILAGDGERFAYSIEQGFDRLDAFDIIAGVRPSRGAITGLAVKDDDLLLLTEEGKKPKGITGSGIISLISLLNASGCGVDSGRFTSAGNQAKWLAGRLTASRASFRLYEGRDSLQLSAVEVDEVLNAARRTGSAIRKFLSENNIRFSDLGKVTVGGTIGPGVEEASLISCGILPSPSGSRFEYLGDASAEGTIKYYFDENFRERFKALIERIGAQESKSSLK